MVKVSLIEYHGKKLLKFLKGDDYRIYVSEGGTRSGKTYTIVQVLILFLLEHKKTVNVFRAHQTTIRSTVWVDFLEVIASMELTSSQCQINNSTLSIRFPSTGAVINFYGCDNSQKMHGLKGDISFFEEAVEILQPSYRQICQRTVGKVILAYNPSLTKHWIYDSVLKRDDCLHVLSTYKDNPFLPASIVAEVEAYNPNIEENVKNGTADSFMWDVYGLGKRARRAGAIYTNFEPSKFYPDAVYEDKIYGLDWGYTHPTALVECRLNEGYWYAKTLIYEKDLQLTADETLEDTDTLVKRMAELEISKTVPIFCDSAYPANVHALRLLGYNAYGLPKPPGSVAKGIELIKTQKLRVVEDDPLLDEAETYTWATNSNGIPYEPPRPVKINDDALDALRYGISGRFRSIEVHKADQEKGQSRGRKILNDRDRRARRNNRARRR